MRNNAYLQGYLNLGKELLGQANRESLDSQLHLSDNELQAYIQHQLPRIVLEWNTDTATSKICSFLTELQKTSTSHPKEAVEYCVKQLIDYGKLKIEKAVWDDFYADAKYIIDSPDNPLMREDLTLEGALYEIRRVFYPRFSWMDMARTIEYIALQERSRRDGCLTSEQVNERETMKNILYDRFGHLSEWVVENNDYKPLGKGIMYKMPRSHDKCENCNSTKGFKWWNIGNKISGQNCFTCGRLLCDSCATKRKVSSGKTERCCNDGVGCRQSRDQISCCGMTIEASEQVAHPLSEADHDIMARLKALADSNEDYVPMDPEPVPHNEDHVPDSFQFEVWNPPSTEGIRRLLDGNLSYTSFWHGVISSLMVLLCSLFAYQFLFPKSESSKRKTIYVKKKRSTFFKGRKSQAGNLRFAKSKANSRLFCAGN